MVWSLINPWWLALVFGVLLLITLRLSYAHVARKGVLLIGSIAVLIFSAYLVWLSFGYTPAYVLAWMMGIALALLINDFVFRIPRGVFYVANKKRFIFPGSLAPFIGALGLALLYYLIKTGQLWPMPWSNWSYLNYVGALLYGFLGGFFISIFMEILRAQKERPIGQTQLSKVYWTVAK
ncbi:MAG: hypothetical protein WAQ53_07655 [Thiofilum sp.]|uniref:DUF6622 family protein n=1 Tax=Thiofilum sp. TaxID=2212733 RepID=UPI002600E3A0|nr:hypothetical protein [Thiofilum sp.]MBK8453398.1 hypothetical protein [Thiofilum sp.]